MKQKQIVINSKLSIDAEQLIEEYFAVKRVGEIEGFVVAEEDFNKRHKKTYPFRELKKADFHAVYQIDQCDICFKSFEIAINDRKHLTNYLQATYKLCQGCKIFHASMMHFLEVKLDGSVAE